MKKYQIKFTVSSELLPTIISLLSREVGALCVEEVDRNERIMERKSAVRKPFSNQRSVQIMLETIRKGSGTKNHIHNNLQLNNYSPGTTSATISKSLKAGLIKFNDETKLYEEVK